MRVRDTEIKLSTNQQRLLKLLFKFRFISTQSLADVLTIGRRSAYEALEQLVEKGLVDKFYDTDYRYAKKPAYYYLNKSGVTRVRKLLDTTESAVHPLYKNDSATPEFVSHCLTAAACYIAIKKTLPEDSDIFTKAEINRFSQLPKNRPDLYIRTPEGREAIIILMDDKPLYLTRKRLDEVLQHSEDEGWDGNYPVIGFILKNTADTNTFLYGARKKLENLGIDEEELSIVATDLGALIKSNDRGWSSVFRPSSRVRLLE